MKATSSQEISLAPPSIRLAEMAWKLAWFRAFGTHTSLSYGPLYRRELRVRRRGYPASKNYYAIIDRLSNGKAP